MLTITHDAGIAITSLTSQQGVNDSGGLRIQTLDQQDDLGRQTMDVTVAPLAESEDQVVTEDSTGARVFLDQPAAQFLEDKVLDAKATVEGDTQFTVRAEGPEAT
ncbi:MAG TPA: iron-sulfur cluster biosynthesis protein [Pseudonocardiaceae bacterium]|jgi:Fe-S cluster assembly iron-binding protein IscA|nr:iron-sulfur cluster biosynthesis protein [Pseudonocardiaceae bacterium]